MKDIPNLTKIMTEGPCGERLMAKVILELEEYMKWHSDSEGIDEIAKCCDLGNKLLTYDYFEESNKLADEFYSKLGDKKSQYSKFIESYSMDLSKKKIDYREFFKIIINNIEDWC